MAGDAFKKAGRLKDSAGAYVRASIEARARDAALSEACMDLAVGCAAAGAEADAGFTIEAALECVLPHCAQHDMWGHVGRLRELEADHLAKKAPQGPAAQGVAAKYQVTPAAPGALGDLRQGGPWQRRGPTAAAGGGRAAPGGP